MGRATARVPIEKPDALNAPLFRLLAGQLDTAGRHIVLDLGAASTPMLSLLGRANCHVQIADLASDCGLERMNADASRSALLATAESLLPEHRAAEALDLVFCWDIPNYLRPEAIAALMNVLTARARPGALAHALVVYSEWSMPERPGRYVPTEDLKLVNHATAVAEIEAPRYSPALLEEIIGGFVIEHARLLANGMQEFLFRLRS